MRAFLTFFALLIGGTVRSNGAVISSEGRDFFESKIRPVLVTECYKCHGADKSKGGLRLDSRDAMLKGGDNGATFVPGDPDHSLLMESLAHTSKDEALHMPKDGAKLDDATLHRFAEWIRMGAPDPRDEPEPALSPEQTWEQTLLQRKQWWCFQPLKNPPQPAVKNASWSSHPVDRFILAKLEAQGLKPAPPADPATLLRRLNYVLTGLPPSPEEIGAFTQSATRDPQAAIEAAADRLISSSRFGEKWARHWMDWVRYAESYGSEGDAPIPYAWRYRDYLIRAFNDDVPYPQMVREAVAGDLLTRPRINKDLAINESALGIGQLRMVLHGFSPTDSLDEMVTFTDNQIDTVSKAFQGLTVSCARCHNHKFDAISQADFYSLFGIFSSTHPAVVDVNVPDAGKAERAELNQLKEQIKRTVGVSWLKATDSLAPVEAKSKPPPVLEVTKRWDLRKDKWFADGHGVAQGPTKAGEFAIATEGKSIIARVHSGGVYSDLISTKDRGVLMSPTFKCEGGRLWMRSAGAGGSRAKYVVQNYPRTGTIHKAKEFKDEGDGVLGWRQLDLDYWKGDTIFIQCATVSDMPAEVKEDARSWFGITDVIITKTHEEPPSPVIAGNPHEAVAAWLSGTMTDAQAELLDSLLRSGKLPNDIASIPAVAPLLTRYRQVEARLPMPTRAPGVLEADAHDAALFVRGDHKQPAQLVPRRFLDSIDPAPYQCTDSGRLELARSLTDPKNPLTSRVIVNRLWHHVFGRGIVATTDNFGRLGEMPTHPELLDMLAAKFDKSGGSMKAMIRFLVTSRTFQLSDEASPDASTKDPENKLLSHWGVHRLEAEAIRDSILTLSGKLEPTMYGPSVADDDPRRSVYVRVIRNSLDPFLTAFDMPVPFSTRGRRDVTNVPAQSLALLNDPTITGWAANWARRTVKEEKDDASRVRRMFTEALGRDATANEIGASLAFVQDSQHAGLAQRDDLSRLQARAAELLHRIDATVSPIRAKLTEQKPSVRAANAPVPYAEWDFESGTDDLMGHLPLKLEGNARIEHGALVLDGDKSFARSEPLKKDLTRKTLEAWVLLDTLDQQGGGVMTVQDSRGVVFDSIVYAENKPKEWLAGSDNHKRTRDFSGDPDVDAAKRPVHVAITYADGKVVGYRDGVFYGKGFKTDGEPSFKAGASEVLLGCRHGSGGGNKLLRGRILRARLYDRALKPAEIEASRHVEDTIITDRDVLDALAAEDRANVRRWQTDLEKLNAQIAAVTRRVERMSPETAGWESLALSLVNLKEFIYLR
jgi:hypothetical protein